VRRPEYPAISPRVRKNPNKMSQKRSSALRFRAGIALKGPEPVPCSRHGSDTVPTRVPEVRDQSLILCVRPSAFGSEHRQSSSARRRRDSRRPAGGRRAGGGRRRWQDGGKLFWRERSPCVSSRFSNLNSNLKFKFKLSAICAIICAICAICPRRSL